MTVIIRVFAAILIAILPLTTPAQAQDEALSEEFAPCADAGSHASLKGTLCTRFRAPLDYEGVVAGTVDLFVRKFPANGYSKGQLWLIAGGPGESGASFYPFIKTVRAAAPGFDVLVPDHRGTGFSTRLCPNEEAASSEAGGALAGQEWGTCFGALSAQASRTRAFTISNAARDLDLLISRFDSGPRTFLYGVSYGTQLVLRTLTLKTRNDLDGVILDSLVPLASNGQLDLSHRSAITDSVGREVLRQCDERPECRQYFPAGAEQAARQVLERSDIGELAGAGLKFKLAALLDFPETREMLPYVIAGLQLGDPAWLDHATGRLAGVGALFEPYAQSPSSIPLVSLISRSENNARPALTAQIIEREAADYLFASPLPSLLLSGGFPVYEPDASAGAVPESLPRTVVLSRHARSQDPFSGRARACRSVGDSGRHYASPGRGCAPFHPDDRARGLRGFGEFLYRERCRRLHAKKQLESIALNCIVVGAPTLAA